MSETQTLWIGVFLIFTAAGVLALREAFHHEEEQFTRGCKLVCMPYLGVAEKHNKCICDLNKESDVGIGDSDER